MLQSSTCSFLLPLKASLQNQGSITQLQLPAKRIQNFIYRNSLKKPFSERKTIISCKSLESYSLENAYISSEHKDEHIGSSIQSRIWKQLDAFYVFMRPYSIIGTLIGVPCVCLLPLKSTADLSLPFLVGILQALVPITLSHIYVNGINQLFDVDIDKVNKPYLPLASGVYSMEFGIALVFAILLASSVMGIMLQSPPVLYALLLRFVVGSAYSVKLPLLRWKRSTFLAATSILVMRLGDHLAAFIHIQKYVLRRPIVIPKSIVLLVGSMCLISIVIGLSKDISDVEGDRDNGIQTFAVIFGKERVFWLCVSMLLIGNGSLMVLGASFSSSVISKIVTVLGHGALALSVWLRAQSVDLDSNASIHSFYMFVWKVVYAGYFLIPFVR